MTVSPTDDWTNLLRRPAPAEAAVLLAVAGGFGLIAGLRGLAVALLVAGGAVVGSPLVAFGLVQAGLLAVTSAPTLGEITLVQAPAFGLLLNGGSTTSQPNRRVTLGAAAVFMCAGLLMWIAVQMEGQQLTAAGFVVVVALVSYLLHRYERVVVGLADGESS